MILRTIPRLKLTVLPLVDLNNYDRARPWYVLMPSHLEHTSHNSSRSSSKGLSIPECYPIIQYVTSPLLIRPPR